jgi:stage II sporulation protein D (peptidoglycan lytic transglycosylase)
VKRFALGALLVWSSAACVSGPVAPAVPSAGAPLPRTVRVQFSEQGVTGVRLVVKDVPLEEYVQATALSEVAPAAGEIGTVERMLELQTIIGRTYAVSHLGRHAREGFDLCSTTHCQLYEPRRLLTSRWATASSEAVARTAGVILTFERQPAQALFHADCGGYTSRASAVWGGADQPYLVARPDDGAASDAHAAWQYEVALADLSVALDVSGRLDAIDIVSRDDAGRVERIAVQSRVGREAGAANTSTVLRGDEFRQRLTRAFGPRALRSTRFDVRRNGAMFVFSGRGYGHGVGLCQAGAFARLRAGATPADVVRYYYPGVILAQGSGLRAQARPSTTYSKILPEP